MEDRTTEVTRLSLLEKIKEARSDSKMRAKLLEDYVDIDADLRQRGHPFLNVPDVSHFDRLLAADRLGRSDREMSEAANLYLAMLNVQRRAHEFDELREKAEKAFAGRKRKVAKTQKTSGQALRAVSEAYRAVGSSVSDRYQAAAAVAAAVAQLRISAGGARLPRERRAIRGQKRGPWGNFRVLTPFPEDQVKRMFMRPKGGLPVLGEYIEVLESRQAPSLRREGRKAESGDTESAPRRDHE